MQRLSTTDLRTVISDASTLASHRTNATQPFAPSVLSAREQTTLTHCSLAMQTLIYNQHPFAYSNRYCSLSSMSAETMT